jgi:hypothetical protein
MPSEREEECDRRAVLGLSDGIAQKGEKFFTYLNQTRFCNVKETTFWRGNFSSLEVFHSRIRRSFASREGTPGECFSAARLTRCALANVGGATSAR